MADKSRGGGVKGRVRALRQRSPFFDHVMAMNEHYGQVEGSVLAGAVTYFGFLSFFPILALAFAVVGVVSSRYPDAHDSLVTAIQQVFPGIVSGSGDSGTISLDQIESAKAATGTIGLFGVLYSGLGWVSGLRKALEDVFEVPRSEQRKFVAGKGIDLVALVSLGLIMIVSVGLAGVVTGAADEILDLLGLAGTPIGTPLVWMLGISLGLAASTLLFYVMFRILGSPELPARPLWRGAVLAAAGFEILKLLVVNVIGGVGGSAFAPLAIAITLVVWINYFSRLTMYGASWAVTSAREGAALPRRTDRVEPVDDPAGARPDDPQRTGASAGGAAASQEQDDERERRAGHFDAGSAVFGALAGFAVALLFGRRPH